jgi:hypothetical protein
VWAKPGSFSCERNDDFHARDSSFRNSGVGKV